VWRKNLLSLTAVYLTKLRDCFSRFREFKFCFRQLALSSFTRGMTVWLVGSVALSLY
jgi:hypothetical protein